MVAYENSSMSNLEETFVPCEICDEMVRFENYMDHVSHCGNVVQQIPLPGMGLNLVFLTNNEAPNDMSDSDEELLDEDEVGEMIPLSQMFPLIYNNSNSDFSRRLLNIIRPAGDLNGTAILPMQFLDPNVSEYDLNLMLEEMMGGSVEIGVSHFEDVIEKCENVQEGSLCVICQEELTKMKEEHEIVQLKDCKHMFCKSCISTWFDKNRKCPLCMHEVEKLQLPLDSQNDSE